MKEDGAFYTPNPQSLVISWFELRSLLLMCVIGSLLQVTLKDLLDDIHTVKKMLILSRQQLKNTGTLFLHWITSKL